MLTRKRNRQAVEAIETLLTLPFALFIVVMIVNFGYVLFAFQAVQNAANYGARVGSTAQSCRSCAAYFAAQQQADAAFANGSEVEILAPGGVVGSTLKIRVTTKVPNLVGRFIGAVWGGGFFTEPFAVSAEATFRAEGW